MFKLQGSVGSGGQNRPEDIIKLKKAFIILKKKRLHFKALNLWPRTVDGKMDQMLTKAIAEFNDNHKCSNKQRIDPHGPSCSMLKALIGNSLDNLGTSAKVSCSVTYAGDPEKLAKKAANDQSSAPFPAAEREDLASIINQASKLMNTVLERTNDEVSDQGYFQTELVIKGKTDSVDSASLNSLYSSMNYEITPEAWSFYGHTRLFLRSKLRLSSLTKQQTPSELQLKNIGITSYPHQHLIKQYIGALNFIFYDRETSKKPFYGINEKSNVETVALIETLEGISRCLADDVLSHFKVLKETLLQQDANSIIRDELRAVLFELQKNLEIYNEETRKNFNDFKENTGLNFFENLLSESLTIGDMKKIKLSPLNCLLDATLGFLLDYQDAKKAIDEKDVIGLKMVDDIRRIQKYIQIEVDKSSALVEKIKNLGHN